MIRQAHPTKDLTVHVQDDYQRDALVIQVRSPQPHGTVALGYAMEDMDGQPALVMLPLEDERRTMAELDPKPGIRLRWDVAVKIAQAVIAHTKEPADPGEVARLQDTIQRMEREYQEALGALTMVTGERDAARESVVALERLVEAKEAHLEREARTADHFHRPVEAEQAKAEVEQARALHPAALVNLQDKVNDAMGRMRRVAEHGTFPLD